MNEFASLPLSPALAAGIDALGYTTLTPIQALALPPSLDAALDALEADALLRDAMGPQIVDTFLAMKRFELERHRQWVSDWELAEYLHHL